MLTLKPNLTSCLYSNPPLSPVLQKWADYETHFHPQGLLIIGFLYGGKVQYKTKTLPEAQRTQAIKSET